MKTDKKDKRVKKNIKIYQRSVIRNLEEIRQILDTIGIKKVPFSLYRKTLNISAIQITQKWLSQKKYCRTFFVQEAFQEFYPSKYTLFSLWIDAMVNILDDLLDENLTKEKKAFYVIEFLRIFSLFESKCPEKFKKLFGFYIEKLITLAIAEQSYQKVIEKEKNFKKIIKYSAELLICRAMDIDVFVEIAQSKLGSLKKEAKKTKEISRVFRAMNILKKDIKDIKHDQKSGISTVITLILNKKIHFPFYIESLLKTLEERVEFASLGKHSKIISNFYQMIQNEKNEIFSLLSLK